MKFRNKILSVVLLFILFIGINISGQDVMSITSLLELMEKKYSVIEDYKADFVFSRKKSLNASESLESGNLKYKFPNKLFIKFTKPYEKDIVCNGEYIYFYIKGSGYYGKQKFNETIQLFDNSKKTITYLKENYSLQFSEEKSLYDFDGMKVYKIKGYPRRIEAGFKRIDLYVRNDGFIVFYQGLTRDDKYYTYKLNNIQINTDISDIDFDEYESTLPDNIQVIEGIFE